MNKTDRLIDSVPKQKQQNTILGFSSSADLKEWRLNFYYHQFIYWNGMATIRFR